MKYLIMSQNHPESLEAQLPRPFAVSALQTLAQPPSHSSTLLSQKRRKFTSHEDQIILSHVEQHGEKGWNMLTKVLPGRDQRTIRERYTDFLDPDLKRGPFSVFEELQLWFLRDRLKWGWSKIMTMMMGRCIRDLKNKFKYLKEHKIERFQRILQTYEQSNQGLQYSPQMLSQLYHSTLFQEEFKEINSGYPSRQELSEENLYGSRTTIKEETTLSLDLALFEEQQGPEADEDQQREEQLKKMIEKSPVGLLGSFSPVKVSLNAQISLKFRVRKQRECRILFQKIQAEKLMQENEDSVSYGFKQMDNE